MKNTAQTLLPLSTLNLQDGRLSGKFDSSTLFAVVTVAVVEVAVVIVAVIEAVLLTVVAGCII